MWDAPLSDRTRAARTRRAGRRRTPRETARALATTNGAVPALPSAPPPSGRYRVVEVGQSVREESIKALSHAYALLQSHRDTVLSAISVGGANALHEAEKSFRRDWAWEHSEVLQVRLQHAPRLARDSRCTRTATVGSCPILSHLMRSGVSGVPAIPPSCNVRPPLAGARRDAADPQYRPRGGRTS